MSALFIDSCSQLKSILEKSEFLSPHNWLISNLECYDTTGWEGCEKWEKQSLILTDEELKNDIYLRDMQFIWGVFSAIPKDYSRQDIEKYSLPELENPNYMANHINPQHPLAFLEISVWDGSYTYICAHDEHLLKPFKDVPYKIIDAEEDNKTMNRNLCRIQDILRSMIPDVSEIIANDIQWECWHTLFSEKKRKEEISDEKIKMVIKAVYKKVSAEGYRFRYTYWNPYTQK
ncbi:MAG: hypothetical protein E7601_07750 [Ruminococcaceae bacterium]|nr:hypothetical protein [Oscillospiraceae bacterium]